MDLTLFLWLLKLGALVNLYFLANTFTLPVDVNHAQIVIPAQILFAVSAYRCLFPNRYKDNVVFHETVLSSTFVTRVLATFAEVAFIYQFSQVIRLLNVDHVGWVDVLSWWMVLQVVISQGFVWAAILTGRLSLYVYEELGWAIIFAANTLASAYLYATVDLPGRGEILLQLNLLFGLAYLPWQFIHLRALYTDAGSSDPIVKTPSEGLRESIHVTNPRSDAGSWGGVVGLTWMTAYWATLIPFWVHYVVVVFSAR